MAKKAKRSVKQWSIDKWPALITSVFLVLGFIGIEKPLCNKPQDNNLTENNSGIINKENSSGNINIQNSSVNSNNTNIVNVHNDGPNSAIHYIEQADKLNTNIEQSYYTNDPSLLEKDDTSPIALFTDDKTVTKKVYLGAEAFVNCTGKETYDFQFTNVSTHTEQIEKYVIDWGDNSNPDILLKWDKNYFVYHRYKAGNHILVVTVHYKNKEIVRKKYNVFLGFNPVSGFILPKDFNLCLNDKATFKLLHHHSNPIGTLYTFAVDDGTDRIIFLHPAPDSLTYQFTKQTTGNQGFTVYLSVESPCFTMSASNGPFFVFKCD